jgi:LPS export ABC transporter protein LptC
MVNTIRTASSVLLLLLLCLSCSFDYEGAMVDENLKEETPESILINFSQTAVKEGQKVFEITADTVEIYEGHTRTVAKGLYFLELDEDGSVLTEGWSDRAVYYNETEDAEFSGNIRLYSKKEELTIITDSISWKQEDRLLETPPGSKVSLKKDDGSFLQGTGFEADLRRRAIKFNADVKGYYVLSEEDE